MTTSLPWLPILIAPLDRDILLKFSDGSCSVGRWYDDHFSTRPIPRWKSEYSRLRGVTYEKANQPIEWLDLGYLPDPTIKKL